MAVWDLRKLQLSLESKPPGPLFLVAGDDPFLVQEALQVLKTVALKGANFDFNADTFFAGDTPAAHVRDTVEMLPMMATRRLVVFRKVHSLSEKEWEVLFPIFDSPVDTTTFVLVAETIDKRKKYYKKLHDAGVIVELKRPYDRQIPMWIDYIARKANLTLTGPTPALIQQFVGSNLSEINNEIQKLRAYIGDRNEVRPEDVLQIVSQSRVKSVFELTNAIGRGDRAQALTCLAQLLEHGQNEVGVLSLITRHVRILAHINEGVERGLSGSRLSTKAGIPQFFLEDYMGQARHWDQTKIRKTLNSLLDTDRALKSSSGSSHIWLENFILQTCG
jgi:DNA polymerase-3 subunit delta